MLVIWPISIFTSIHTKPVVNPEVWEEIPDSHVGESVSSDEYGEYADSNSKTKIAQEDEFGILGFVQRAGWVEMVDTGKVTVLLANSTAFVLTLVVVVASNVEEKVHGPAEKLLAKRVDDGSDRGFLGQLMDFVNKFSNATSILLASLGNKDHITLHVASCLVVLAVGDLPGEIWDEKCRVKDPASGVVENLGLGERLVTALVCQNPDTSGKKTLHYSVETPQHGTNWHPWDVLRGNKVVEEVEGGRETGEISSNIA